MPLRTIPYETAYENITTNEFAKWPSERGEKNRLEPVCMPATTPKFILAHGAKVFTIGACFARNVEGALLARGYDVVTRSIADHGELARFGTEILTNFGIPSIFNEFQWALDGSAKFDDDSNFFETSPDRFVDIHLPVAIRAAPLETVRRRRAAIASVTRRVVECSLVILTLGLTEVWYDRATGRYLNHWPVRRLCETFPGRFELHVLNYEESLGFLRKIIALLNTHCPIEQKILITVAPSPLNSTFTGNDVLVANCYSKSVLRVISEVAATENDSVDYFPVYESVTLTDRKLAWKDDLHHVQRQLVDANVGAMIASYSATNDADDHDCRRALADARELVKSHNILGALRVLEPVAAQIDSEEDILFYCNLCARVGCHSDGLSALGSLPQTDNESGLRRLMAARLLIGTGDIDQALAKVISVTTDEPRKAQGWQLLTEIRMARSEWNLAIAAQKRWAETNVRNGEPQRALATIYRKQGKVDAARGTYQAAVERGLDTESLLLEYAEFLVEQGLLEEARPILQLISPAGRAKQARFEALSGLVL